MTIPARIAPNTCRGPVPSESCVAVSTCYDNGHRCAMTAADYCMVCCRVERGQEQGNGHKSGWCEIRRNPHETDMSQNPKPCAPHRFAVAPMMDWTDSAIRSIG